MSRNKVITADAAAGLVLAGDTIATTGFVGTGFPEELALALERRFLDTGEPRDLTLIFAAGQGEFLGEAGPDEAGGGDRVPGEHQPGRRVGADDLVPAHRTSSLRSVGPQGFDSA